MRGLFCKAGSLALVLALMVGLGACGGSNKVNADKAQAKTEAKATVNQVLTKDPKVKKQATFAENHLLGCGLKVHGHIKTRETQFLSCEGFSQKEIGRAKPCLNKSVGDVSVLSLRDKSKRDQIVVKVATCVTA